MMTSPMSSSLRSSSTTSAPAASSAARRSPARSRPTTSPKPPRRPASTPAAAAAMTMARAGTMPSRRTASRTNAGAGIPATSWSRAIWPSTTWSKTAPRPAAARTAAVLRLEVARTTGIRPARSRSSSATVPGKTGTGRPASRPSKMPFWCWASPAAVHSAGLSAGEPRGMVTPREARKETTPASPVRPSMQPAKSPSVRVPRRAPAGSRGSLMTSSTSCFQAAARSSPVSVTTPSRSKITASTGASAAATVGDSVMAQSYQRSMRGDSGVWPGIRRHLRSASRVVKP